MMKVAAMGEHRERALAAEGDNTALRLQIAGLEERCRQMEAGERVCNNADNDHLTACLWPLKQGA